MVKLRYLCLDGHVGGKMQEGRNAHRRSVDKLTAQKTDNSWKVNMKLLHREVDYVVGR